MADVRWTLQAADDLEAIVAFIGRDSMRYARFFAVSVLAAIDRLATFPYSGRVVPEQGDNAIREIILGSYRIVYRVQDDAVQILTVCHGSRLFDPRDLE
jgi:plasmid stabilization system protein ParE